MDKCTIMVRWSGRVRQDMNIANNNACMCESGRVCLQEFEVLYPDTDIFLYFSLSMGMGGGGVMHASYSNVLLYELCFSKHYITRQIWGIWKLRPAYSPETPNLGQNRWCFVPCDLEIWWMTLENNRASVLCCFKLCATFHSQSWIQTGVTVRKRQIWVKFDDF